MSASNLTTLSALVGGAASAGQRTVIGPNRAWDAIAPRELWRYRDLLWLLAKRDVQVRYRQAVLGIAWAIVQPLVSMIVLQLVFGQWLKLASTTGDVPYPIFLYAGLVPWLFFAASVTSSTNSFISNASIVQKVYVPRLLIPLASLGAPLLDYLIAMAMLGVLMIWFGTPATLTLLLLPMFVGTTVLVALGVGILLAALAVRFRDFRHVVPFVVQVWFFITPVLAPTTALPEAGRWLMNFNPMTGTIGAFRSATLGLPIDWSALAWSVLLALALLSAGLAVFAHTEKTFADVI